MKTKITTKSLLPAIEAFVSSASKVKQKSLMATAALVLLGSASNSYGEFEISRGSLGEHRRTAQASHFLSQATMGADLAQIDNLAAQINTLGYYEACEAWIDAQFALPKGDDLRVHAGKMHSASNAGNGNGAIEWLRLGFYDLAVNSPEQLRHRMAFALGQIFVVSTDVWEGLHRSSRWKIDCDYYDMLADAGFKDHRTLLQNVTYNPLMGNYLSSAQNGKGDPENGVFPDENYGREVMQLFSCGVFSLWPNGTTRAVNGVPIENYDDTGIKEMAQVFTGLSRTKNGTLQGFYSTPFSTPTYLTKPMKMNNGFHDTSSKILPDGTVLPAGQTGDKDISDALDMLAEHPSTAPYMSMLLIKRFTSSNPSNQYVKRVRDAWENSDGDFKVVIKAILLDPEARDAITYFTSNRGRVFRINSVDPLSGRLKEPVLKLTQFLKFFGAETNSPDGRLRVGASVRPPSQIFQGAKSVFNFYAAEYAPGSGPIGEYRDQNNEDIVAPEMQILPLNVIDDFENAYAMTTNPSSELGAYNGTELKILDHYGQNTPDIETFVNRLDLYYCQGTMPFSVSQDLKSIYSATNATGNKALRFSKLAAIITNGVNFSVSH